MVFKILMKLPAQIIYWPTTPIILHPEIMFRNMRQNSRLWRALYNATLHKIWSSPFFTEKILNGKLVFSCSANSQPCITILIILWKPLVRLFWPLKLSLMKFFKDNIEFLQNELRSKDKIIKILMDTQAVVLENLPLSKPPQLTENNTSFCNYPQENVNQLNQNIIFKS